MNITGAKLSGYILAECKFFIIWIPFFQSEFYWVIAEVQKRKSALIVKKPARILIRSLGLYNQLASPHICCASFPHSFGKQGTNKMVFIEKMKKSLLLFFPRLQPTVCKAWTSFTLLQGAGEQSPQPIPAVLGTSPASPAGIPVPFLGRSWWNQRNSAWEQCCSWLCSPLCAPGLSEDAPSLAGGTCALLLLPAKQNISNPKRREGKSCSDALCNPPTLPSHLQLAAHAAVVSRKKNMTL